MPTTNAIITTSLFDQKWPETGEVPPGRDLADALLKEFTSQNCGRHFVDSYDHVSEDDWEHNTWFFFITFEETVYTVFVASSLEPEERPGIWCISFRKYRGILKSLFQSRGDETLSESFGVFAERLLKKVTKCDSVIWVSDEEVARYLV